MTGQIWNRWRVAAALSVAMIVAAVNIAHAQSASTANEAPLRLVIRDRAPLIADQNRPFRISRNTAAQKSPRCNRGRRALIGGLIGGAASYPLANLAYRRFDNEAATDTGAALAALVIGGSAAAGALIGWNSCK